MLINGQWRVTMADVDGAGIIYYASPLRWAEVLLGDWLEQLGHPISSMFAAGEATPVVGVKVRYRSMLSLDDHCRLELWTERIGATSFTLRCEVRAPRGEQVAVEVLTTHAYVIYAPPSAGARASATKRALPPWLKKGLEIGVGPDQIGVKR